MLTSAEIVIHPVAEIPRRPLFRVQPSGADELISLDELTFNEDGADTRVSIDAEVVRSPCNDAQDLLNDVAERAKQVAARQPDSPSALTAYGIALMNAGRAVDALPVLRTAVGLRGDYYLAHAALGRALSGAGDLDAAQAIFERLAKANPQATGPLVGLADVAARRLIFPDAVAYLKRAADLRPNGVIWYLLGIALLSTGERRRYAEAISFLKKAVREDPRSGAFYHALGVAYALNGSKDRAERQFRAALKQRPFLPEAVHGLTEILVQSDRGHDAVELLVEATKQNADDYRSYELLAWCYLQVREYAQARAQLVRALSVLSEAGAVRGAAYGRIANNLGVAYRNLGDKVEAGRMFERAHAADATAIVPAQNLARTRLETGRADDAVRILGSWTGRPGEDEEARMLLAAAFVRANETRQRDSDVD